MATFGAVRQQVYDRVSRTQYYQDHLQGLTAQQRHQELVRTALSYQPGAQLSEQLHKQQQLLQNIRTDADVLQDGHRFLRSAEDDAEDSWEVRLAKKYYSRLFKEYAIADLALYKEGQLGLRWRTEAEVVAGKGQFLCGARKCPEHAGLASYEVNFAYQEAGQHKQALVKVRLCPSCAAKLNYHKDKQYRKLKRRQEEQEQEEQERECKRLKRLQKESAAAVVARHGRSASHRAATVEQQRQQQPPQAVPEAAVAAAMATQQPRQQQQWPRASGSPGRVAKGSGEAAAAAAGTGMGGDRASGQPGGGGAGQAQKQQQQQQLTDAELDRWLDEVFAE